ncbi:MAG: hypothetical protein ACXVH3_38650, partial [Solirubrobacteraceae bacterium]
MLEKVDVAILDLGLPNGNGADLTEELYAASRGAQAVVLTSSIDPAESDRVLLSARCRRRAQQARQFD